MCVYNDAKNKLLFFYFYYFLVDKKEVKAGHDPEKELKDGFQDVGRV